MADITPVDRMDNSKKNSPIAGPVEEEATVMLDSATPQCYWNDQEFADGVEVCNAGTRYQCSFGNWVKQDDPC